VGQALAARADAARPELEAVVVAYQLRVEVAARIQSRAVAVPKGYAAAAIVAKLAESAELVLAWPVADAAELAVRRDRYR